jgi:alpha-1,2-glucosyltransferase
MLYIWPFIVFFSAPLIAPIGIRFLWDLANLLSIPLFPRLIWKYFFTALYAGIALSATLLIIKFNTLIHPFTLADNRHYMFYVFRYTVLRHPLVRYLLAPIYLGCAWFVYLTLCTPSEVHVLAKFQDKKPPAAQKAPLKPKESLAQGPKTSLVIILLASTTLSLIGAPLVEPRYFIIPWVIWRLNVPNLTRTTTANSPERKASAQTSTKEKLVVIARYWGWEGHDYRLWVETTWFIAINAVTGYIFLYRGFEWPQEPGKVQRFMW